MKNIEPWMQTYKGMKFWITRPTHETINIEDIAHSLSLQCRYNGHTKKHYSVAQHSVIVSKILPDHLALSGLMHDAAESYIGDQIKPYKDLTSTIFSESIEKRLSIAIYDVFGIQPYHFGCPEVKEADLICLRAEALQVLSNPPIDNWHEDLPKKEILITEWGWQDAEKLFLERFYELKG